MKIIKRSGVEAVFDAKKISAAIQKANESIVESQRISAEQIQEIADEVEKAYENMSRFMTVEEIQDIVEDQLMSIKAFALARAYITYRYKRAMVRKSNTTEIGRAHV